MVYCVAREDVDEVVCRARRTDERVGRRGGVEAPFLGGRLIRYVQKEVRVVWEEVVEREERRESRDAYP